MAETRKLAAILAADVVGYSSRRGIPRIWLAVDVLPRERARNTLLPSQNSLSHTIFICCLSSLAKMFFGMSAWTPRTMSTT